MHQHKDLEFPHRMEIKAVVGFINLALRIGPIRRWNPGMCISIRSHPPEDGHTGTLASVSVLKHLTATCFPVYRRYLICVSACVSLVSYLKALRYDLE